MTVNERISLFVLAVVGAMAGPWVVPWVGSAAEVYFRPILTDQVVTDVEVANGHLCWEWQWIKARAVSPIVFRYYLNTLNVHEYPVVLIRTEVRDRRPVSNAERPQGAGRGDFCVALPEGVNPTSKITLHGFAEYKTPHGVWSIRQPLPTVEWTP